LNVSPVIDGIEFHWLSEGNANTAKAFSCGPLPKSAVAVSVEAG